MTDAWHLSIDFGTSNTAAAHTSPLSRVVEAVALSHRSNLMPSAVFVDRQQDSSGSSHTMTVGDSALTLGRRTPQQLSLSPKRYIDHEVIQLGGESVPVTEVIGAVLRAVSTKAATQHRGTAPETVTLTHPEAWSGHSIEQLVAAASQAGIAKNAIRLISEPRAAAIHYAAQERIHPGQHVVVFDFGGGTLDIAVLQASSQGNFTVVATKGDNSLGGRTVDNLLYRWVLDQVGHDDPDLADYLKSAPISTMHALEQNIREAKEMLSETSSATITVSTPQGETDLLLTRDEFNRVIDAAVTRAVELTSAAMSQANVNTDTTPIYMTGGSSRIPHMQNRLGEIGNVNTLDDPKTVVSRGALAATLMGFTISPSQTGGTGPAGGLSTQTGGHTGWESPGNGAGNSTGSSPAVAGLAGAAGAAGGFAGAAATSNRSQPPQQPSQASQQPPGSQSGWQAPQGQPGQPGQQGQYNQPGAAGQSTQPGSPPPPPQSPQGTQPSHQGHNPFAHPPSQATPSSHGPVSSSVPEESTQNKSGGGTKKTGLLIGAGLAGLLLLGVGGVLLANVLGGDEEPVAEHTTGTDQSGTDGHGGNGAENGSGEGGGGGDTAAARNDGDQELIDDGTPAAVGVLPASYTEKITACFQGTSSDAATLYVLEGHAGDEELTICHRDVDRDSLSADGSSAAFAQGEDAQTVVDYLENDVAEFEIERIREASGEQPTVWVAGNSNTSSSAYWFWYAEDQVLVLVTGGYYHGSDEQLMPELRGDVEDVLGYYGI